MNFLFKKAIRDFRKLGWRKYLILSVIALCIGGSLAINYTISSSMPMMNSYFNSANHADYIYQLDDNSWINSTQLNNLNKVQEIKDFTGRLFWPTSIKLEGQNDWKYVLLIGLNATYDYPEVYRYFMKSGINFNQDSNNLSAIVDDTFFSKNKLSLDSTINITGLNNASLRLTGTFNAPEFIMAVSNPEFILPIEGSMAIIYLSQETLKNYIIDHYKNLNFTTPYNFDAQIQYFKKVEYNNLAVTFREDISINEGNIALTNYIENNLSLTLKEVNNFYEIYPYSYMKADLEESSEFMWIIQIFIALTGIFIIYVVFNRYTFSQSQQTGFIEAMGYSKKDIHKYYLLVMILIYIISIPLGIIIGYSIGYLIVNILLTEMANLELFEFPFLFLPQVLLIGLITGGFMIFFSIYLPVRKLCKKDIAKLVYQKTEIKYKRRFKFRIPKLNFRKISTKLTLKNSLRNKKRLTFSLLSITFSLLIISSTQSMLDSMFYNIDLTFNNPNITGNPPVENWNLNVQFQNSVNISEPNSLEEQIKNITGIEESTPYVKGIANSIGKVNQSLLMIGIDLNSSTVHNFRWKDKIREQMFPLANNEIIISSVQAIELKKNIGNNITIINQTKDIIILTIVGIHRDLTTIAYISDQLGKSIFHSSNNVIDGIFIILDPSVDKIEIKNQIYNLGNIEVIFDSEEMAKALNDFISNFFVIFYVLIYYTLVVALIIILYNSIMNIYDKNYEYGILRSLGYSKKKIGKMIITENMIQGIIPIILTLIFTYPLAVEMAAIYEANFPLDVFIGIPTILYTVIPPIILYIIGSFIAFRVVYKKNLYEQVQTNYVS